MQSGTFYVMAEAEDDPGHIYRQAETRMKGILEDGLPYRPGSPLIAKVYNMARATQSE